MRNQRISEARDELHRMLEDDGLRGAKLLVLANKQDMRGVATTDKVADRLGLLSLRSHEWHLQPCSAVDGTGLYEGMSWLHSSLKKRPARSSAGG